jgi:hypothetical protein
LHEVHKMFDRQPGDEVVLSGVSTGERNEEG